MSEPLIRTDVIATSSVEEGLDFACNLISDAVAEMGKADSSRAGQLLGEFTSYLRLRYAGELLLATEYLAGLGHACDPASFNGAQFWAQLRWIASEMDLTPQELAELDLPT
jgi:hypothetical protein